MEKRRIKCGYCGLYCDAPWKPIYVAPKPCEQCGGLAYYPVKWQGRIYCDECFEDAAVIALMDANR